MHMLVERGLRAAAAAAVLAVAPLVAHAGIAVAPLPEPDTLALLAIGVVAAVVIAKKRGKK